MTHTLSSSGGGGDGDIMAFVMARLERALGPIEARTCVERMLKRMERTNLSSPDDLLRFAECLLAEPGIHEVLGRALKVSALLRGAREFRR